MNDPMLAAEGAELPAPTFFDPAFERLPAAAGWSAADPDPVLLLYDPRADRTWVADAAIALATGWAQSGRETVIVDLNLDEPLLHERIGIANQDGIVDVFLYGTSLKRAARPVPGRGFSLITPGTYAPEPEAIYANRRWPALLAECREADAAVLLLAPAEPHASSALAEWAPSAILLGAEDGIERLRAALPPRTHVRCWLAPAQAWGASDVGGTAPEVAPFARGEVGTPAASAAGVAPPAQVAEEFRPAEQIVGQPPLSLPVPDPTWSEGAAGPPPRRRVPVLLLLLLLVVLAAGAYYLFSARPDLLRRASVGRAAAPPGAAGPLAPPARTAAAPAETGAPLPFAVAVVNFDALEPARKAARAAAARFSRVPFYVVPEDDTGRLYYKVFAGALPDTASAARLRDQLISAGVADTAALAGPSQMVQQRPWAFELGNYAARADAERRAAALDSVRIPTYLIAVPLAGGAPSWRVLGGAFADTTAARSLKRLLALARVEGRWVRRVGTPEPAGGGAPVDARAPTP